MALYVGGELTITDTRDLIVKELTNAMWGGYQGMSLSGNAAEHYVGLSELIRGFTLTGYKSSQCGNDINKTFYPTDTTTHIADTMCQGNYHRGGSAPLKGGISWAACGCQGSSADTRLYEYSTETLTSGPARTSRQNNGSFDYEGYWMSYAFAGGSTTNDVYNWKNQTFTTLAASPHTSVSDTSFHTHHLGYAWDSNNNSSCYQYNMHTNSWSGASSNSAQTSLGGSVCPAWSCLRLGSGPGGTSPAAGGGYFTDEGKGYACEHGGGNTTWKLHVTSPGNVNQTAIGAWPGGRLTPYNSEVCPLNGNRHSRTTGGYNGGSGQHTYGSKIQNFSDVRMDVPSLDATSDKSGVSSGTGICSSI